MDDFKQSLKKVFEERIASPLFGYITLAWIGFNWKPLVLLFLGKEPPAEKITMIGLLPEYAWQLWTPLWVGALLASLAPYLHLLLQQVHHLASLLKDSSTANEVERRYRTEKKLVKSKVQSSHAESLETARQKTKEAILEARRTRIEANTQTLVEVVHDLQSEVARLQKESKQILAARTLLEQNIKGIINGLIPLEKAETADDLRLIQGVALSALEKIKVMEWPKEELFIKHANDESDNDVVITATGNRYLRKK